MSVRAVIFDISGTVLDYGSRGPVRAFVEVFRRHGVAISEAEARRPMGAEKRDHIAALLADPAIGERWLRSTGALSTTADLDELYREFTPIQLEVLPAHCDVIPGVPALAEALRERGVKFANTTGFARVMMKDLIPLAAEGGYTPDCWVCPDDVGAGRPAPWMAFHAAKQMGAYPMHHIVKVGDTPVDIAEAHAAGMWAVAVVRHGNETGLSREDLEALPDDERETRILLARERLAARRPHYLLDQTADLLPVLDEIGERLARGERPY